MSKVHSQGVNLGGHEEERLRYMRSGTNVFYTGHQTYYLESETENKEMRQGNQERSQCCKKLRDKQGQELESRARSQE